MTKETKRPVVLTETIMAIEDFEVLYTSFSKAYYKETRLSSTSIL